MVVDTPQDGGPEIIQTCQADCWTATTQAEHSLPQVSTETFSTAHALVTLVAHTHTHTNARTAAHPPLQTHEGRFLCTRVCVYMCAKQTGCTGPDQVQSAATAALPREAKSITQKRQNRAKRAGQSLHAHCPDCTSQQSTPAQHSKPCRTIQSQVAQ